METLVKSEVKPMASGFGDAKVLKTHLTLHTQNRSNRAEYWIYFEGNKLFIKSYDIASAMGFVSSLPLSNHTEPTQAVYGFDMDTIKEFLAGRNELDFFISISEDNQITLSLDTWTGSFPLEKTFDSIDEMGEMFGDSDYHRTIWVNEDLANELEHAIRFCSDDSLRPGMQGVFFRFRNEGDSEEFVIAATDAHRMLYRRFHDVRSERDSQLEGSESFIVPSNYIRSLNAVIDSAKVFMDMDDDLTGILRLSESGVSFEVGSFRAFGRLIGEHFPDIEQIVGNQFREHKLMAALPLDEFLSEVKSMSRISAKLNPTTNLAVFSLAKNQYGEADLEVEIAGLGNREKVNQMFPSIDFEEDILQEGKFRIGINSKLLKPVIDSIEGEYLHMYANTERMPVLLSNARYGKDELQAGSKGIDRYVIVMPIMLGYV